MASAPTITRPSAPRQQGGQSATATPVIPFTRASRKKTRNGGVITVVFAAGQQALAPVQIPAAGYLRNIRLQVTCVTAGNAAATAFNADAPFNALQAVSLLAANGDSIISPLDGFALAMVNKYGCFNSQLNDPLADPGFSVTTGAGATGGSFNFNTRIPCEIDARDGLCALPNMAANQSFLLQMSLAPSATVYSVAPTAAGTVTITIVLEYWAAPSDTNAMGNPQAIAPPANGSVSLLQIQNPVIAASTDQTFQLLNVGNTIRWIMFILRTAPGVRTEADWPNVFNLFVQNDPWHFKTKNNWRQQMNQVYGLGQSATIGPTATPTKGALDNGVFVLTDFMEDGCAGDNFATSASNRNQWLVTNSAAALTCEAANWGAAAGQLLVITNSVRVSDPAALYQPFLI